MLRKCLGAGTAVPISLLSCCLSSRSASDITALLLSTPGAACITCIIFGCRVGPSLALSSQGFLSSPLPGLAWEGLTLSLSEPGNSWLFSHPACSHHQCASPFCVVCPCLRGSVQHHLRSSSGSQPPLQMLTLPGVHIAYPASETAPA